MFANNVGVYTKLILLTPGMLIIGLIGLMYYILFQAVIINSNISVGKIFGMIFFNFFLVLGLTSFLMCVFTNPGFTPDNFSPETIPESQKFLYNEELNESEFKTAKITYCAKCENYRPARSHHCGTCNRCVLRYDHHCPLVMNCVGFFNHKFFTQLLLYFGVAAGILGVLCLVELVKEGDLELWAALGVIAGFCLLLGVGGFGVIEVVLIGNNSTYFEDHFIGGVVFDTGSFAGNLSQVFGKKWFYWLLPIRKYGGNGMIYPVKIHKNNGEIVLVSDQYLI